MKEKIPRYLLGVLTFLILFLICFISANLVYVFFDLFEPEQSGFKLCLFVFFTSFVPIILSYLSTRLVLKRYEERKTIKVNWLPRNKRALYALIFLYLITVFMGSPAVQSHNSKWAIEEYKRINTGNNPRVRESHPYIKTFVSIPIIPFIIVSYHEYQLDGLYGWGGWDIHIWYLGGVKRIIRLPLWLS
jgi:hypothetical protein